MRQPLALTVLALLSAAAGPLGAQGTTEIFLQRGADGRAVISDQPRRGVTVEKTWRMEREDPEAARERAAEVRRHAAATSDRVQRSIDAQQERQAAAERQRSRALADQAEQRRLAELRAETERPVVLAPWLGPGRPYARPPDWRPPRATPAPRERSEPPRRRPHASQSRSELDASAAVPGSR
jgi:hypothetical protein